MDRRIINTVDEQIAELTALGRTLTARVDANVTALAVARGRIDVLETLIAAVGADIPWTPLLDQTGTVPITVNHAVATLVGDWCIGEFQVTATGAGGGGPIRVARPVTGSTFPAEIMAVGSAYTLDAAGGAGQLAAEVVVLGNEPTWFRFIRDDVAAGNYYGADPAFTLAAGDKLAGHFAFRVA